MINKSSKSFDFRLLLILPLLAIVVAIALLLNNEINHTSVVSDELDIDNSDLEIEWNKYSLYEINLEEPLNITRPGTYTITGSLTTGGINIDVTIGHVKLILDGVTIKNPDGPAIYCSNADALVIESKGNNYLEDGDKYSEYYNLDVTGAIYTKSDLVLTGNGQLDITSNYQDGIISKDDLTIRSGIYNIVSEDDGIRGKDSVHIINGEISVNSKADGIKSTDETDHGKGFVYIEDGDIIIKTGDDGIHATKELVIDNGSIEIVKSYEGLESPKITINNGDLKIKSVDDGINAGTGTSISNTPRPGGINNADENCIITINGGDIYINAAGDGIDSNGFAYLNDGKLIIDGPTNNKNSALDAGLGFVVNGGQVIAIGSSGMAEKIDSKSTVNNISVYLDEIQKPDTVVEVKDSYGNIIFSHDSAKSFSYIAAASNDFVLNNTYILYINNQEYAQFTIDNTTTTISSHTDNRT